MTKFVMKNTQLERFYEKKEKGRTSLSGPLSTLNLCGG